MGRASSGGGWLLRIVDNRRWFSTAYYLAAGAVAERCHALGKGRVPYATPVTVRRGKRMGQEGGKEDAMVLRSEDVFVVPSFSSASLSMSK